jgi:putative thioredoxin
LLSDPTEIEGVRMSAFVTDVTAENFQRDVIDASHEAPVLVDFWAPWCAPCRALGPVLEQLATEYGGRFRVAKVNSDEEMGLAGQFGVRGIPNVKAFVGGRLVDEFTGALPAAEVRRFVDGLLPTPGELERRAGLDALAAGRLDEALAAFDRALGLEPDNDDIRIDQAGALAEAGRFDDADTALARVRPHIDRDGPVEHVRTRIAALRARASGPDAGALQRAIDADPGNLDARLAFANLLVADRRYEDALAQLIEIVRRDRRFRDDAARKLMLSVFEFAADDPDLVSRYRRELSRLLY